MHCSVVCGVTLMFFCHKHFVVFSGNQHRRLLPAMCHNLRDGGRGSPATALTTPACCSDNTGSQARYRLRIAISAYPSCIRRPRYRGIPVVGISPPPPFGMEKQEWCGYPMVKNFEDMFIRFDMIHKRWFSNCREEFFNYATHQKLVALNNRASARADTQMTHRKESNTESGHNTKWLITANGPLQS